jgi:16S rRNA (uracil1498-N3)-methyltransferase
VYVDASLAPGRELALAPATEHYLTRVLRLGVGGQVALFDGRGHEYLARLVAVARRKAVVVIDRPLLRELESPLALTLVQAVSRGERMDYTLQKAVELGVSRIVPVLARRSPPQPSGERAGKRGAHWQGVVIAACQQCGRSLLPELQPLRPLLAWLAAMPSNSQRSYVLDPAGARRLRSEPPPPGPLLLLVGPEGGLDGEELAAATTAGFLPLALGPRLLRTETAGVAALAALQALWGDLG